MKDSDPGAGADTSAFDPLHRAATTSASYREAVRISSPDLPGWLVPASVITLDDLKRVKRGLALEPGEVFLDLGCGAGGPAIWVVEQSGTSCIGVDQSLVAIRAATALARTRGLSSNARFVCSDIGATGLPGASVDGVMSIDSFMFVDPWKAVAEMARLLRPGRTTIIRVVESLIEPFTSTLVRSYGPIFQANGLTVTRYEEVLDYNERSTRFFRAIAERAEAMRIEVGADAAVLIDEARESVKKAAVAPRVRIVYIEATRILCT